MQKPTPLAFNLMFAGVIFLMLYTAQPYLGMFVLAFVFVVITAPWYRFFLRYCKSPGLSAIVTTIATVTTILLPLYFFLVAAINQFYTFFTQLQTDLTNDPTPLLEMQAVIERLFPFVSFSGDADAVFSAISTFVQNYAVPLVSGGVSFIMSITFFLITVIYFYLEKDAFLNFIKRIIPLPKHESVLLVDRIVSSTNTIIVSIAMSALAQAIATIIPYWLLGVPALTFWFFALFFAAFLPLGSGLITVPISVLLMLTGNVWGGLALLIWHAFGVSSIDNIVRARFFKKGAVKLPELVTLLATLGGIVAFGFFGIIYGPLIAIVFMACLEIYERHNHPSQYS